MDFLELIKATVIKLLFLRYKFSDWLSFCLESIIKFNPFSNTYFQLA